MYWICNACTLETPSGVFMSGALLTISTRRQGKQQISTFWYNGNEAYIFSMIFLLCLDLQGDMSPYQLRISALRVGVNLSGEALDCLLGMERSEYAIRLRCSYRH